MNPAVIDTSVFLALLTGEPIRHDALSIFAGGVMSAANAAEVFTKLEEWNLPLTPQAEALFALLARVEPLTLAQALVVGALRSSTRRAGIGLGDRCCMALALQLGSDAYTTDREWAKVDVGCKIQILRDLRA